MRKWLPSMRMLSDKATLIAAEKTGRTARLIEFDPLDCDVVIRRFEASTGKRATLAASGAAFEAAADNRVQT